MSLYESVALPNVIGNGGIPLNYETPVQVASWKGTYAVGSLFFTTPYVGSIKKVTSVETSFKLGTTGPVVDSTFTTAKYPNGVTGPGVQVITSFYIGGKLANVITQDIPPIPGPVFVGQPIATQSIATWKFGSAEDLVTPDPNALPVVVSAQNLQNPLIVTPALQLRADVSLVLTPPGGDVIVNPHTSRVNIFETFCAITYELSTIQPNRSKNGPVF